MIALFQLEQGVPIPSKTESPDFVYTFYALISCSNTGTWTVTVDTSACVTQGDMSAAIAEAVKTKQDKIMVKGLLLGDGNGNISAAVAGRTTVIRLQQAQERRQTRPRVPQGSTTMTALRARNTSATARTAAASISGSCPAPATRPI